MNTDTSSSQFGSNIKERLVLERTHCTHCGRVLSTKYDNGEVHPGIGGKTYCDCAGTERAKMMETLNRKDRRDLERSRGMWQK